MIRRRCKLDSVFSVDAEGRSKDLILMWKDEIDATLKSMSKSHIDVVIPFKVTILAATQSDHCQVVLDIEGNKLLNLKPATKRRKFTKAAWLKEDEVPMLVKESWTFGSLVLARWIESTHERIFT